MLDVLIAGVGGQGSVLAAKIIAYTACDAGWQVRSAETIGMAQRGGSVTSHVRIGNEGEDVYAPLTPKGCADVLIGLEPGEALRSLPLLKPQGLLVCASTAIPSVASELAGDPYRTDVVIDRLCEVPHHLIVDDHALCERIGGRKPLNVIMLAAAVQASLESAACGDPCGFGELFTIDSLKVSLEHCVRERFIALNCSAVDITAQAIPVTSA
jgi:indolepyruvate ferredoxin oxidoreductase beta subunit